MIKGSEKNRKKLIAYCRGFLLTKDKSIDIACAFCKGFLLTLYGKRNRKEIVS